MQSSPRRAYEILRSAIRTGYLSPGDQLVESDLVQALSISRNAIRQALQLLADEGLVERAPKRGTIVTSSMVRITLNQLNPLERVVTSGELGVVPGDRLFDEHLVEDRIIPSTPYIRHRLGTSDPNVRMHEHLITVRGQPSHVWVGYVEAHVDCPTVDPNGDRVTIFREHFGVEFGRSEDAIEAVPCEERTSRLLGIAPGSPVLLRETLLYDVDGRARELRFRYSRGDRISFFVEATEVAIATSEPTPDWYLDGGSPSVRRDIGAETDRRPA